MKCRWRLICMLICALMAASAACGASTYSTWMRNYTQDAQKQARNVSVEELGFTLTAEQEEIFRLGVAYGYDLRAESTGDSKEMLVWIPVNGGKKYHLNSDCSNMKNPKQVSIIEAERLDYEPCGRCFK